MLSEYEASVLTKCRMKGCQPPHSSRPLVGSAAAIGLILIGTLLMSIYERPRAIELGPTWVFNWDAVAQPPIGNASSVVP